MSKVKEKNNNEVYSEDKFWFKCVECGYNVYMNPPDETKKICSECEDMLFDSNPYKGLGDNEPD